MTNIGWLVGFALHSLFFFYIDLLLFWLLSNIQLHTNYMLINKYSASHQNPNIKLLDFIAIDNYNFDAN